VNSAQNNGDEMIRPLSRSFEESYGASVHSLTLLFTATLSQKKLFLARTPYTVSVVQVMKHFRRKGEVMCQHHAGLGMT
jgi:hypothetical protein